VLIVDETDPRQLISAPRSRFTISSSKLARSGIAVIAISSELPEVLAISDRIVTMREGRVTGEIKSEDANEEILMSMMTLSAEKRPSGRKETMTQEPHPDRQTPGKIDLIGYLARFAPLIFLIILMAGFAFGEPRFLTPLNLFNVLRQVSIYGLLAVGP